jgi:uncharacterized protein YecE (DUF72 family)
MRIRVGTASWTDPTLIKSGAFYPAGCNTPEERLRYYASQFPLVEINASYYAVMDPQTAQHWVERTPEHFTFNAKAFRLLTGHQTPPAMLPQDVRKALGAVDKKNVYLKDLPVEIVDEVWHLFLGSLYPLHVAGKLGLIHFQFPPWFVNSPPAREYLEEIRRRVPPDAAVSVEFRNKTWFAERSLDRTLELEQRLGLVHTVLDAPQGFTSSVGGHWEVTNPDFAFVRLHGRNTATWEAKGLKAASDRFDYDYSNDELSELAKPIAALVGKAKQTHVVFNNNNGDQGQRNAATLQAVLEATGLEAR